MGAKSGAARRAVLLLALALLPALATVACAPGGGAPPLQGAADATNTALASGAAPPAPSPSPRAVATALPGCCLRPAIRPATATAGGVRPLEVRAVLYSPETGYALLLVHNPNPTVGLHRSPYRVALRGDDGRLLGVSEQGLPGSLDQTIFALPPSGTVILEPRFVPAPVAPAAIEPVWPAADQFQPWPGFARRAEGTVEEIAPGRLATAVGQVRNLADADANLIVSVALFDDGGQLVNGAQDVVENVPAGGAAPFRIPLLNGVTAGRVEIFVWPSRLPGLRDWSASAHGVARR